MDIKRLPWVSRLLLDIGLEDMGGGFWTSPDGSRALYLGGGSLVVITNREYDRDGLRVRDFETSHPYPTVPDESWLIGSITDHVERLLEELTPDDLTVN